jgi:hypothetical protein
MKQFSPAPCRFLPCIQTLPSSPVPQVGIGPMQTDMEQIKIIPHILMHNPLISICIEIL